MTRTPRPRAVRTLAPQGAPPGIYASKYDPELGAAICRRLAAGESLRSICRSDPSMPTEKTVWNWARRHPEFAAWRAWALTTARARAMEARVAREQARRAKWAAEAEAVRTGPAQGRVLYAGGRGSHGLPAWNRGLSGYGPDIADAICDRLCLGETLQSVCRDPDMPSIGTVYNWLRANPEFLDAYRRARELAFDYIREGVAEQGMRLGPRASLRHLARIERAARRRCAQLAPKGLADGVYVIGGKAEPD